MLRPKPVSGQQGQSSPEPPSAQLQGQGPFVPELASFSLKNVHSGQREERRDNLRDGQDKQSIGRYLMYQLLRLEPFSSFDWPGPDQG